MSMRDQYENLDKYAAYDYKDVSNAYGHGEDDAIDRVLEIIDGLEDGLYTSSEDMEKAAKFTLETMRNRVEALRGE